MQARVLVLDDDPGWLKTICDVLTGGGHIVDRAYSIPEALALLERSYFNVAVIDLRLNEADQSDYQGLAFMQALAERGLEETLACIVLTAYGNSASVRRAFRDYKVVDVLDKIPFQARELLDAVSKGLERNDLKEELCVEIAGGGELSSLWQHMAWAGREDSEQLVPELRDLLCRLFPGSDHVFIKGLPAGQSGAGVMEVHPYYGANVGVPVVVKFGKRDKIAAERRNYQEAVERFLATFSSTQLRFATGRLMGSISYQLVGTELNDVMSLANYYEQHDAREVCAALDNLFQQTCSRWYVNREQPRRDRDLIELYTEGLHIKWDEVWAGAESTGFDLSASRIVFPDLGAAYPNPRRWLAAHERGLYLPAWRAFTHGDLNEHNVLVTEDGRCWLIDFYRSGLGHILRDVVELETAVKFSLVETASLEEHAHLEAQLLRQAHLNRPVSSNGRTNQRKTLAVVSHLRSLAAPFTSVNQDVVEYNVGLLLTTLNLLRLPITLEQRRRALLSASMICQEIRVV